MREREIVLCRVMFPSEESFRRFTVDNKSFSFRRFTVDNKGSSFPAMESTCCLTYLSCLVFGVRNVALNGMFGVFVYFACVRACVHGCVRAFVRK